MEAIWNILTSDLAYFFRFILESLTVFLQFSVTAFFIKYFVEL